MGYWQKETEADLNHTWGHEQINFDFHSDFTLSHRVYKHGRLHKNCRTCTKEALDVER
jgi:hypothetical protein